MYEKILDNQTLYFKNVISYRGLVSRQQEVADVINHLEIFIENNKSLKSGPTVTVTQ